MKKLFLIAVLLFAFGTASAQTGRDTISTKQKDKSSTKMKQDKTASPSTTRDQNKKSAKKDPKSIDATRTNSTEMRNPDGTLRSDPSKNDRNPAGTVPGGTITDPVPGSTSTPTGTVTPPPGGTTPK